MRIFDFWHESYYVPENFGFMSLPDRPGGGKSRNRHHYMAVSWHDHWHLSVAEDNLVAPRFYSFWTGTGWGSLILLRRSRSHWLQRRWHETHRGNRCHRVVHPTDGVAKSIEDLKWRDINAQSKGQSGRPAQSGPVLQVREIRICNLLTLD